MRRFKVLAVLTGAAAFALACNGDMTTPSADRSVSYSRQGGSCREITQQRINALFPPGMRGSVSSQLAKIRDDVKKGNTALAQTEMFQLWQQVLDAYYVGSLNGGQSAGTQTMVLNFGADVYCLVGLDGSSFLVGNPLGADNKLQVVFPSGSQQTVVSGNGKGGTQIDGGTLTTPGTVTIVLITDSFDPFKGPLHTKLDQYGPFFEIKIVPEGTLNQPIHVAQCIAGPANSDPPPTVHLAHNVGSGIEILGLETAFLDCSGTATNGPGASEYFARGETLNGLKALGRAALSAVTPAVAYAGGVGVGGKTSSFSPYGGVDTAVVMDAVSATSQSAPAASAVPAPPSVRVHTTGANTSLDGANVTFAITSGAGAITGANQVTNAGGTATVGSWALGAGANSLSATGAFPAPPSGTGVGINGSPVAFSGTGTDVISWEANGYKYLAGAAGHDAGFEAPGFADGGWSTGRAAFGDHNAGNLYCALDASVHTNWVSVPEPTDMLLRHSFSVAAGWPNDLTVSVAIDNDIQVFVNGTELTSGFVTHEGCAERGSFTFAVSHTLLTAGNNVIAVRARDRGVVAFVDIQVVAGNP
jgi:hypothetical protein